MITPAAEHHLRTQLTELQSRYDVLTRRIKALDTDMSRELDIERTLVLQDRRAELANERTQIADEMERLENSLAGVLVFPPPPDTFVGREDIMGLLRSILLPSERCCVDVAIVGMGGLGKTTFAKKLGGLLASKFPGGVLWLDVGFGAEGAPICRQLSLRLGFDPFCDSPSTDVLTATLQNRGRMLVILDDIWEVAIGSWIIKNLLPDDRVLLITTRDRHVATYLSHHVLTLQPLTDAESLELLTKILGPIENHLIDAQRLVTMLDGLPLALEIATRLCILGTQDLPELVERLEQKPILDEMRLEGDEDRDTSLRACLDLSYEHLDADSKRRFRALSAFAPTPFDLHALAKVWGDRNLSRVQEQARHLLRLGLLSQVEVLYSNDVIGPSTPIYRQHEALRCLAWLHATHQNELSAYAQRHAYHFLGVVQDGAERGGWRWWSQVMHAYHEYFALAAVDELLEFRVHVERFDRG